MKRPIKELEWEDFEEFIVQAINKLIDEINNSSTFEEFRGQFTKPVDFQQVKDEAQRNPDFRKKCVERIQKISDEIFNKEIDFSLEKKTADTIFQEVLSRTFNNIRQGTATNRLTKFSTRKKETPDPISGILKMTSDDFTVVVEKFLQTKGLRTSTWQLFDALTQEATRDGVKSLKVKISLQDFMNVRGLKDEQEARKQIKEDLGTLSHLRIEFNEYRRGRKTTNFINVAIIGTHGIKNNEIVAVFDTAFLELYKTYNVMPYPTLLYRLNNKYNPNSFYFGRKITEHKNMNYNKPNADIISVEALLNSSPVMPSYDEISKNGRHYAQQIINPFERDMDALEEIFTWEYCHSNGTPLTDEELEIMSYDIFIKLLVKITWRYYPERNEQPKLKAKNDTKPQPPIAL